MQSTRQNLNRYDRDLGETIDAIYYTCTYRVPASVRYVDRVPCHVWLSEYGPHFVHENARKLRIAVQKNFLASPARLFYRFLTAYIFGDFGRPEPTNLVIGVDVTLWWILSFLPPGRQNRPTYLYLV